MNLKISGLMVKQINLNTLGHWIKQINLNTLDLVDNERN